MRETETFNVLLDILRISGDTSMQCVRQSVDAETRLAVALYWYASGAPHRHIGDLFGISKQFNFVFRKQCTTISAGIPADNAVFLRLS
jgi:hypothetical protein